QMGESIAEGTLSRWMKKVGDAVKRDEPIFEISTDKVDAEIPAPAAGVLAEILVQEGQTVAVNTVVARRETDASAEASAPAPAAPRGRKAGAAGPGGAGRLGPRRRAGPGAEGQWRRRDRGRAAPPPFHAAGSEDRGRAQHRHQRRVGLRDRRTRHQERHRG